MARIKAFVSHMQVVTAASSSFAGLSWPSNYVAFLSVFQFLDRSPLRMTLPACINNAWKVNAYDDFLTAISLPVASVAICALYSVIRCAMLFHKRDEARRHVVRVACTRNGLFLF
eukprot:TRINITY_DN1795_c0_g1_i2.p4 TRINITY_DN1795_c0_g1~~TRINITY_DN1795_c0_g1_i2.p4  ORF type:complete len:115 (+),score=16.48 TRINITY_DN1795_c0_g1_i2:631-975(+)